MPKEQITISKKELPLLKKWCKENKKEIVEMSDPKEKNIRVFVQSNHQRLKA